MSERSDPQHEEDPIAEVGSGVLLEVGGTLEGLAALLRKPGESEDEHRRALEAMRQRRKSA